MSAAAERGPEGGGKARETCDHPSRIVPAILAETEEQMRWRRESAREAERIPETHRLPEPEPCSPEAAREIAQEFGIPELGTKPAPRGPLRTPTREDYIAMGVDPAVLGEANG